MAETRAQKDAAFAHVYEENVGVFQDPQFKELFDELGVESLTQLIEMEYDDFATKWNVTTTTTTTTDDGDNVTQETSEHSLTKMKQRTITNAIEWYLAQESPDIKTWSQLTTETLATFVTARAKERVQARNIASVGSGSGAKPPAKESETESKKDESKDSTLTNEGNESKPDSADKVPPTSVDVDTKQSPTSVLDLGDDEDDEKYSDQFTKSIKFSARDCKEMKLDSSWKQWISELKVIATLHDFHEVFDDDYDPKEKGPKEQKAYAKKNVFVYRIFLTHCRTPSASLAVQQFKKTMDGREVYQRLRTRYEEGATAHIEKERANGTAGNAADREVVTADDRISRTVLQESHLAARNGRRSSDRFTTIRHATRRFLRAHRIQRITSRF
ncbi:hypothetical protein MPSEU_000676800 [Mayamaea pseudoterrestris]|nr:hypothetical protein MPSEU_000676800 [Mayamaea pseudoterrestris]